MHVGHDGDYLPQTVSDGQAEGSRHCVLITSTISFSKRLLDLFFFLSLLFFPLCLQQISSECFHTGFERHKLNLKLLIICSQERHYRSIPVMLRAFVFCFAVLDE